MPDRIALLSSAIKYSNHMIETTLFNGITCQVEYVFRKDYRRLLAHSNYSQDAVDHSIKVGEWSKGFLKMKTFERIHRPVKVIHTEQALGFGKAFGKEFLDVYEVALIIDDINPVKSKKIRYYTRKEIGKFLNKYPFFDIYDGLYDRGIV